MEKKKSLVRVFVFKTGERPGSWVYYNEKNVRNTYISYNTVWRPGSWDYYILSTDTTSVSSIKVSRPRLIYPQNRELKNDKKKKKVVLPNTV